MFRPWFPSHHHEFLEQVTPEEFRGATLYSPIGIPVVQVVDFLVKDIKADNRKKREANAREEVRRALEELLACRANPDKPGCSLRSKTPAYASPNITGGLILPAMPSSKVMRVFWGLLLLVTVTNGVSVLQDPEALRFFAVAIAVVVAVGAVGSVAALIYWRSPVIKSLSEAARVRRL